MIITPEVQAIDKDIIKVAASYRSQVSPTNANDIMRYILKKKKDVGIIGFSYNPGKNDVSEIQERFSQIEIPPRPLKQLYKEKIQESIEKFKLGYARGTANFSEVSESVYGYPSKKLIAKAYDILTLEPGPTHEKITQNEAKKILIQELKRMGLSWKVQSKKMLSYAMVSPAQNTVTLSSTHTFSETTVRRLAIHEIGTHSVRSMNARQQPLKIFRNFPRYIATEEGLAAFNEEITGHLYNDTIRKYAGRVIAVEYAQDHTLMETYNFLKKYFTETQALYIALRVKRGLPNTESHGAFTKDHVYLKGFLDVKEYVKKNPLKNLYYGKVNLEYANLIEKLEPELKPIKYFPPLVKYFEQKKDIL